MFKIYSAEWCEYCQKAKDLLDSEGLPYTTLDIDDSDNANAMKLEIKAITKNDPKTIPQILYLGHYVGGYGDLQVFLEENFKNQDE